MIHKTVYSLRGFRVETVQYFMALYTHYGPYCNNKKTGALYRQSSATGATEGEVAKT
jgi:hypothetical protein